MLSRFKDTLLSFDGLPYPECQRRVLQLLEEMKQSGMEGSYARQPIVALYKQGNSHLSLALQEKGLLLHYQGDDVTVNQMLSFRTTVTDLRPMLPFQTPALLKQFAPSSLPLVQKAKPCDCDACKGKKKKRSKKEKKNHRHK